MVVSGAVDDGRVALQVTSVEGTRVVTRVVEGGIVSDNKGRPVTGHAPVWLKYQVSNATTPMSIAKG